MSPNEEGLNPDDVCFHCGETRENHGDRKHKFSIDGDTLEPITAGPPRRQNPPQERPRTLRADGLGQEASSGTPLDRAFATLVEVLAEKELLNTKDVIRIFSGQG